MLQAQHGAAQSDWHSGSKHSTSVPVCLQVSDAY
jgi:hypothetical protein